MTTIRSQPVIEGDRPSCANGEADPATLRLRPGSKQCRCGGCHRVFWSVSAFDRHQMLSGDGKVICRDPATLGMVQNRQGMWMKMRRVMQSMPTVR
jgi:hypothetical protein